MKNMKFIFAIFILAVITFTGFGIYLSFALQSEKLELVDISGDRAFLDDFLIRGTYSDGFRAIDFSIDNGNLTNSYRFGGFVTDSWSSSPGLIQKNENCLLIGYYGKSETDEAWSMTIRVVTGKEGQELYRGLLYESNHLQDWEYIDAQGWDKDGKPMTKTSKFPRNHFNIEAN